jgi:hypothetical protein
VPGPETPLGSKVRACTKLRADALGLSRPTPAGPRATVDVFCRRRVGGTEHVIGTTARKGSEEDLILQR